MPAPNRVGHRVAIVEGVRTPFAKSGSAYKDMTSIDLGTIAVRELLARSGVNPADIDEVIYGTVIHSVLAPNIAREVGLAAGVPATAPAYSVARACASSNQAITSAAEQIMIGYADTIVAGGAESLTDIPIMYSKPLRETLVAASKAKSAGAKVGALTRIRPAHLAPVTPAIAEPSTGETMGQSAERMAKENGITREAQDRWALRSHQLAAAGTKDGRLREDIVPTYIPPKYDEHLDSDNGIREDTTYEKLAALKPVFDRKYGSVTAGNASPLTDGASAVLLMSEEKVKAEGIEPLGYIRSWAYTALAPSAQLLQGPAYAAPIALEQIGRASCRESGGGG